MKLVVDTNILIAALIKNSVTREILLHPNIDCFVSEFIFREIALFKKEILRKSGLSGENFKTLFEHIKEKLNFIPDEEIRHKKKAMKIIESIDIKDSVFIAIALSIENDGIWSEDKHFEKQHIIKLWKTRDIINYLGITHK